MATASPTFDFQAALHHPARFFGEPEEILRQDKLSRDMKVALLEQWERDARGLMVAEEEGMSGGEVAKLGRIRRALHKLRGHSADRAGTGTKHGS